MAWKGFKDFQTTILIDLNNKSEEEVYLSFNKDARYCIRKAEKNNLVLEESRDWEDFYPIYKQVIEEGGVRAKKISYLKSRENYRLFLVKLNGQTIGGAALGTRESKIIGVSIAAIDPEYKGLEANYFLYWNLIKVSKREGFEKFDMGGYQLFASKKLNDINRFKEKWNGQVVRYDLWYFNPIKVCGRKVKRLFDKIVHWRE